MLTYILIAVTALAISYLSGKFAIPLLYKLKAGQTILSYVKEHESKNGTPTMGGLFFVFAIFLSFVSFGGYKGNIARVCLIICFAFMFVGFLDDFIKIRNKTNEGLKPYQKIIFQVLIGVIAGYFAYKNGITFFYIPFTKLQLDVGLLSIPIIAVIFIAITNSVNLTDGLDGLAGSVSTTYLAGIAVIILLQVKYFSAGYYFTEEYDEVIKLCFSGIGALVGFLIFNVSKAKVFMGDTGSLALGGLLGSITVFTGNALFIPVLGIMFVLSSISVIIQVAYYKKTKKRVFLMAPFHHHLQHKGLSETKITYIYTLITALAGALLIIGYLI